MVSKCFRPTILTQFVDPVSVLNGTNRDSRNGSGWKNGTRFNPDPNAGIQGGSTFVEQRFKSTIAQNTEIPTEDERITVPFITIELL